MKISTRGRYGLRAVIDLAIYSNGSYISLASIAERQDLSANYMESIFWALKNANIVTSSAGLQGGYMLVKKPEEMTLEMVLSALEGDLSVTEQEEEPSALRGYLNDAVWNRIDETVMQVLRSTTVKMLADEVRTAQV